MDRLECPGENTIVAFAEGNLAAAVMARVEEHARSCALCQELLPRAMATGVRRQRVAGGEPALTVGRSPAPDGLARGTSFGRYTILSRVGRGGMGEVYAAYDPELDRRVALKLLRVGGDAKSGHARLLREAKAMAKVAHPNVVSVHDAGVFDASVFVAMDFVDGSTMRDWLAERPRARHEILAVFIQAAHGLMAAHAAGLVHRDFKPGNVMISRDGSVRVTDFGLARKFGDTDAAGARDTLAAGVADLGATLTATGQVLGTPRYMSPEQFKAEPADARTDQFGFCVALYEALYGVSPFGDGSSLQALTAAVLAGRVQPAPPKSSVPNRLRSIIVRGLSLAPGDRWPSMRDLVAELTRDPSRVRRRWILASAVALLVALPVFFLAYQPGRSASLCRGGPAHLAGAWEPLGQGGGGHPRRDAIERAFLASGAPDAKDVWTRVAALLDRYAAGWLAMYEDACAATHVHGAQSASALDLRMSCLDERRTALVALTAVLAEADRGVIGQSVDAVNALPDLERCGDIGALQIPIEPPRDEATRFRVAEFRRRLANAKALHDTGKHVESQKMIRSVIADARTLGYRPALAQALGDLAGTVMGTVEAPDMVALTDEALWTTLGVGRDDLAAGAALARLGISRIFVRDPSEWHHWRRMTNALIDRAGTKQERLRSWLLQAEALIQIQENDREGALVSVGQAIALKKRILPARHPDIAISQNTQAEILHFMGRDEEALRMNLQIYDVFSDAYGPASVEAAYTLSNRGDYLVELGRQAEALASYRDALSRWEAHVGPQHQNISFPLTGIGRALVALGRAREAIQPLERALRLRDPKQTDPELVAETQFALGQALAEAGADQPRASSLATKALETYRRGANERRAAVVQAWLDSRRH